MASSRRQVSTHHQQNRVQAQFRGRAVISADGETLALTTCEKYQSNSSIPTPDSRLVRHFRTPRLIRKIQR